MREIKFRVWDEGENRFWHFGLQDILERRMSYRGSWDEKVARYKKTQYTGLKDKNGVEIYEGDIIRSDKDSPIGTVVTAKVYWKGAGFALLTTRGSDTTSAYLELLHPFCEIIGNIYENPELMEASE